jgi:hypothetical protein
MFSRKLKIKLLLLLTLSLVTLGAYVGGGTASASCGKCDSIVDRDGNVVGYACIQTGMHNCVATASGCTFPGLCSDSGGGPQAPVTPPPRPN